MPQLTQETLKVLSEILYSFKVEVCLLPKTVPKVNLIQTLDYNYYIVNGK